MEALLARTILSERAIAYALVDPQLKIMQVGGALSAFDGSVSPLQAHLGHLAKSHLPAIGGSDAHLFDVLQRLALGGRIANHHFDFILVALQAQGFTAVKCVANLLRQVAQGQPETAGGRFQFQLEFFFARQKTVGHIGYPGIALKLPFEVLDRH